MSLIGDSGSGIVLTDLFISATAALLLVLAVARPSPPVALPVQADMRATCYETADGGVGFELAAFADAAPPVPDAAVSDAPAILVQTREDFARATRALQLSAQLFVKVALTSDAQGPAGPTCLRVFEQDIMRPLNREPDIDPNGAIVRVPTIAVSLVPTARMEGDAQ